MSRRSTRRLVPLFAVALLVVAGACSDNGNITMAGSTSASTTTTADEGVATTDPTGAGDEVTEPEPDPGDTVTTEPGAASPEPGTATPGDADQESADRSWNASPGEFRGQDGLRVAYECPPDGVIASVWGIGPFTDDSSVCTAAVFAGLITTSDGGRVIVQIAPGADTYATGEAHGVRTGEYGVWAGSFTLVR